MEEVERKQKPHDQCEGAIRRFDCFHKHGVDAPCHFSNNPSMITFGILQIFLSQIPNFHKVSWPSIIAAIGYASIGIALSLSVVISGNGESTSIYGGSVGQFTTESMWNMLVALGNVALASTFAVVIFDIQDTLKSSKPENEEMKKANLIGLTTMAVFFLLCACTGYAVFGDETAGNIMTGSKIFKPLWVMYLDNVFIVVHLVGAYQVIVETFAGERWASNSSFVTSQNWQNSIHREYAEACLEDIIGLCYNDMKFWALTLRTFFPNHAIWWE